MTPHQNRRANAGSEFGLIVSLHGDKERTELFAHGSPVGGDTRRVIHGNIRETVEVNLRQKKYK
jgi:hypothetical protein